MIGVVGLGYVGLPLAVAFSVHQEVYAFDVDEQRIQELKAGKDRTNEIPSEQLHKQTLSFSSTPQGLASCTYIIIAVPTPITDAKQPNLSAIMSASKGVGKHMSKGATVVYESTVFPGCTEEVCVPLLEQESGMKAGVDFHVGYSPERINPGDKEHSLEKVTKVVSGESPEVTEALAQLYGTIVPAGIHKASSIKVAEAAKVIENTQRDVNIALMNELALIFDKMDIPVNEVLEAARTKWNFAPFKPGLVGGHCIGVDPYYLAYKAQQVGYHPELILGGRRLNDSMSNHLAKKILMYVVRKGWKVQETTVGVLGLAFKPNVPDVRNARAGEVIHLLEKFGFTVKVCDPLLDEETVHQQFSQKNYTLEELKDVNVYAVLTLHNEFKPVIKETTLPVITLTEVKE